MDRRYLLSAAVMGLAAAGSARASASESSEAPAADPTVNITGVALPVIVDGRIRNYVFVGLKLYLAPGKAAEEVNAKEAYYRDALVRTAHRAELALSNDWNRLSVAGINGAMMAIARVVSGPGVVTRSEVVSQSPRRQVYSPPLVSASE